MYTGSDIDSLSAGNLHHQPLVRLRAWGDHKFEEGCASSRCRPRRRCRWSTRTTSACDRGCDRGCGCARGGRLRFRDIHLHPLPRACIGWQLDCHTLPVWCLDYDLLAGPDAGRHREDNDGHSVLFQRHLKTYQLADNCEYPLRPLVVPGLLWLWGDLALFLCLSSLES